MDLPRIELGALRLLSACDTTTPQTHLKDYYRIFSYIFIIWEKSDGICFLINKKKKKNYGFAED